jgi:hypothetical protein
MKHSESLEKLMSCEGMDDIIELCEVFVILGPNEESLCKLILVITMDRD